jgi:thiol-disulfide isomerase/thioredoxin
VKSAARAGATAVGVAIVLGAGVAGFVLHRLTRPEQSALRAVPPAVSSAGSATAPGASAAPAPSTPAPPERLPDFSLPDLGGTPRRLSDWRGRPLVINFWASWCEPCRREIPLLEDLRRENAGNGLEVVGIAVDHPEPIKKLAAELGIGYPVLVGEEGGLQAVTAFGMDTVLPFTVFADKEGRIVTLKVGELHRDEAAFILARLSDLGAGTLSLAAAREEISTEIRRLAALRASSGASAASQ